MDNIWARGEVEWGRAVGNEACGAFPACVGYVWGDQHQPYCMNLIWIYPKRRRAVSVVIVVGVHTVIGFVFCCCFTDILDPDSASVVSLEAV